MGCGDSRQRIPFREKESITWRVTNSQWKSFVERTYTDEVIEESGCKVDYDNFHKEMTVTEVGSDAVVARQVYMGVDFVSFGRLLVPKSYWHSYEGDWVCSDIFFNNGQREVFKVEKSGTGLSCLRTFQAAAA